MAKKKVVLVPGNLVTCALYAVIGLLLIILKAGSLNILMTIIGALFIVYGIFEILKKNLIQGVVMAVIGAVVIICGWTIAEIVLLIFGILLAVYGVLGIVKNIKAGFPALLSPIVTVVIGVLLIVAKWALMDVMCIIAGVVFLINAVLALFGKKLA